MIPCPLKEKSRTNFPTFLYTILNLFKKVGEINKVYLDLPIYLSSYLSIYLSNHLSIHPSILIHIYMTCGVNKSNWYEIQKWHKIVDLPINWSSRVKHFRILKFIKDHAVFFYEPQKILIIYWDWRRDDAVKWNYVSVSPSEDIKQTFNFLCEF